MTILNLILLALTICLVVVGAMVSTRYAERFADSFYLSKYVVGFIVISFVSILPETIIAVNASLQGESQLGLGTLFGSNVADLTLIIAILTYVAGKRKIKVEKTMLSKVKAYPLFLLIPLLLGMDGNYTREEGLALIVAGVIFYVIVFRKSIGVPAERRDKKQRLQHSIMLLLGMALLLVGAHYTVIFATNVADGLGVSPILIGLLVVSLGTTMPELFFSARAVKHKQDSLALSDIMGAVLADATIVLGILAVISPFSFSRSVVFITGAWMLVASLVLIALMRKRWNLTRAKGLLLLALWLCYVVVELSYGIFLAQ